MTTTLSCSGPAALCFVQDGKWFQGFCICASSRTQLGLMGEELSVDDCVACSDGGYQEYCLTVMHFALDKEVKLVVKKTGGNLCQLNSDTVQFHPSMLLTDDKAVEAIETYFPSIAERVNHDTTLMQECTVCFGEMEITGLAFPS
ncbi:hypothetical protein KXD40_008565 [Peronospora effusa]|uniref:Uncharacterized protein n=1 Tax=Peronospora effusa TaxID=542832 RepID=A0A3M6VMC9_9STRA|nr:hypothetical protein DD238_002292 [Peronospora effusa]RQM17807.1 hypothetical protein DD237_001645 [Peronospora effusa]UIZ24466.1 hypothetical protein KXD40_008565 [Peronospora effusa]